LLALNVPVRTFLHGGFWLDIGRVEDFQKAQELDLEYGMPAYEPEAVTLEPV
jgi:mannose-1-phosphate guanylyltransferase